MSAIHQTGSRCIKDGGDPRGPVLHTRDTVLEVEPSERDSGGHLLVRRPTDPSIIQIYITQ